MILHRRASALFAVLLLPATLLLSACGSLKSISILPVAGTVTLTGIGQTVQYSAFGASQMGNANPTTSNITTSVTWSVSNPYVAAISSTGDLTAVGPGFTQVLAQSGGFIATSDVTVTISSSGGSSGGGGTTSSAITGINIIPGTQTVSSPGKTAQYLAIGINSAGVTSNLTNLVAWSSSSSQIATIGPVTGLATAIGAGTDTITALYTNQTTGGIVTGTASFTVAGGTSEQYTGVQLLPGSQTLSASGQTGQFIALGTAGNTGLAQNVTSSPQIIWSSSVPSIATVSSTGLVTGLSAGNSTITALLTNSDGSTLSATSTVTVAITAAPEPILSLEIIPSTITVGNLQDTGQFLAIGTFSTAPYVRDLTNSPTLTWISSAPTVFPVNTNTAGGSGNSAGLATAYGNGGAVIIAEAKAADGTIQTATATFNCPLVEPTSTTTNGVTTTTGGTCFAGSQAPALLATLTVFNEGANSTGWLVTAASATGTPNVIHCGPGSTSGGSVCVATYPIGTTVTLTAPAESGVAFGGWTYNCIPTTTVNANGPNTCSVTLNTNDTVGGIFN